MPLQNGSSAFAIELLQLPWRQVYDDDAEDGVRPALGGDPGGSAGRCARRRRPHRRAARRAMSAVDPTLGRIPRVMVPVQLDALVLREPAGGFADCRMREPDPAGPPRQELLPPPFADLEGTRPAGVYLHWALPDALTHERPGADGAPGTMPAMPDRWLVARLSLGTTPDRRAVTGWVIEASGATPTATPLAQWTESGRAADAGTRADGARPRRPRLVGVLRQRRRPARLPRSARRRRGRAAGLPRVRLVRRSAARSPERSGDRVALGLLCAPRASSPGRCPRASSRSTSSPRPFR